MKEYYFHGCHNNNKKDSFQCTVHVIEILSSTLFKRKSQHSDA